MVEIIVRLLFSRWDKRDGDDDLDDDTYFNDDHDYIYGRLYYGAFLFVFLLSFFRWVRGRQSFSDEMCYYARFLWTRTFFLTINTGVQHGKGGRGVETITSAVFISRYRYWLLFFSLSAISSGNGTGTEREDRQHS